MRVKAAVTELGIGDEWIGKAIEGFPPGSRDVSETQAGLLLLVAVAGGITFAHAALQARA